MYECESFFKLDEWKVESLLFDNMLWFKFTIAALKLRICQKYNGYNLINILDNIDMVVTWQWST